MLIFALLPSSAGACPACWAGYGSGDERFNKPLADLRKVYEAKGNEALPYIHDVIKTSSDPKVIQRAGEYIVALNDLASLPLLEDMVKMLAKRVTFGEFGYNSYEFKARMAAAHAISRLTSGKKVADFIWQRFERIPMERKVEVPYLLNALKDPELEPRMFEVLDRAQGHQLMINALISLQYGGSRQALEPLQQRIELWAKGGRRASGAGGAAESDVVYSVLAIKGSQVCAALSEVKP